MWNILFNQGSHSWERMMVIRSTRSSLNNDRLFSNLYCFFPAIFETYFKVPNESGGLHFTEKILSLLAQFFLAFKKYFIVQTSSLQNFLSFIGNVNYCSQSS